MYENPALMVLFLTQLFLIPVMFYEPVSEETSERVC